MAFENGVTASEKKAYTGTLEFVTCHLCWKEHGIDALKHREELKEKGNNIVLDDDVMSAASKVNAEYVALDEILDPYEDENWPDDAVNSMIEETEEMESAIAQWRTHRDSTKQDDN
ncbi:hypothetical protein D320_10399 [Haloferax sp. BAB-2207]|nr:hypothetical protein D320_10399 [Haloferax sp. BAB-2207]